MVYVIDFDDVLFDKSGKYTKACQVIGVDFEGPFYKKAKEEGIYNFEKHLEFIAQNNNQSVQALKEAMEGVFKRSEEFLFPETISTLKKLRKKAKKMILISRGNHKYQMKKIKNSGVLEFFDQAYVIEGVKLDTFKQKIIPEYSQEKIVFIDDKQSELEEVKKFFPEVEIKNSIF